MATYAIGDVQGCYPELQRLLDKWSSSTPRRIACGSAATWSTVADSRCETLRLIHQLRECTVVTLGNHDLSLLSIAQRKPDAQARVNPELREVLFADDAPVLFEWLRSQKLLHHDEQLGWTMVHAGLAPGWTLRQAQRAAQEVERELSSPRHPRLLRNLFGNRPATWSARLQGVERFRASINMLTRMRYCDVTVGSTSTPRACRGHKSPACTPGSPPRACAGATRASSVDTGQRWGASPAWACTRSTPAASGAVN